MWICDGCMANQGVWKTPTHYRECGLCGRDAACADMPQQKKARRDRGPKHKHEHRRKRTTKRGLEW